MNNKETRKILSNLLHEITSKQNWHSKVFDPNIVQHWKQEFLVQSPNSDDLFDMVVGFARATAQGSVHKEKCPWVDNTSLCDTCKAEKTEELKDNPTEFGYEKEDLTDILKNDDWIIDCDLECNHPRCDCVPPDFDLHKYIQYHPSGVLNEELKQSLKEEIQKMLDQEPIDWHPNITADADATETTKPDQHVRDLVHPSMYCYVKGVSKHTDESVGTACDAAREEDKRYQWLPSIFKINEQGHSRLSSYINNLDADKYPKMLPLLERALDEFLPSVESVLKTNLKNRDLQVITKIGTIYLDPSKPEYPGGSWHIEGMPYEHIAATCIHYLDVQGISDSFLEFRKPVLLNEEDCSYPQNDANYTTHHYGISEGSHHEGQMNRYLGLVKCHEGASIVFPNTLQHKVKPFTLADGKQQGIRTILVFFVIDPNIKIVSTADVPPQRGIFTRAEAEYHRQRLMLHRKYFVSLLNQKIFERPYSLCEH